MNKKIGILGWKTGPNSFGITVPYFKYISFFGSVVVIEPNNPVDESLDLLILPGGADLSTGQYELDKFDINIQRSCPIRSYFMEKGMIQKYIDANIPLFGICLGHQMLAAFTGNKLVPDMQHETNDPDERWRRVHDILVNDEFTREFNLKHVKNSKMKVNSIHHQAVSPENVVNAEIVATHSQKKNTWYDQRYVEALKYTGFRGYSVQWHPEEIWDELATSMIRDLLNPVVEEENNLLLQNNEVKA